MASRLVLRALTGELRGQEFSVTGPTHWVLGRSRSCTLRLLGDDTISRQHCVIEINARGVWVQDLGSLNGTHLNGERIGVPNAPQGGADATFVQAPARALNDGDELRICRIVFAVCLSQTDAPAQHAKRRKDSSRDFQVALSV